jgi:hypothetical protein
MALLVSRSAGAIRGENFGRVNEEHFFVFEMMARGGPVGSLGSSCA